MNIPFEKLPNEHAHIGHAASLYSDTLINRSSIHTISRLQPTPQIRERNVRYDTISEDRSSGERQRILSALLDRSVRRAAVACEKSSTQHSDRSPKGSGLSLSQKYGMYSEMPDNAFIQSSSFDSIDHDELRSMSAGSRKWKDKNG